MTWKTSHPINFGCLTSSLASAAPARSARTLECETLQFGCHALSPLRVGGMCHCRVISDRHSFARPALPGVIAHTSGSDFHAPPPASSLFTLVRRCPLPADRCTDLPGYHVLSMSGSIPPRTPGSVHATDHDVTCTVACRGAYPVGTLQRNFRGSTPSGSASPVTFAPRLFSCLRIVASVTLRAARLDTGLAAHDYPGGTLTR